MERKLRRGERPNLPWGGIVSQENFPKALYKAANLSGFESQTAFAVALDKGKHGQGTVGNWYRGKHVPTPEEFCKILTTINVPGPYFENLVASYACLVELGRGSFSRVKAEDQKSPEGEIKSGSGCETDELLLNLCKKREIDQEDFLEFLGFGDDIRLHSQEDFTKLIKILEKANATFDFCLDEAKILARILVDRAIKNQKKCCDTKYGITRSDF